MEFKEYLAIIRRRWMLFFPIFALIVAGHLVWISYGEEGRYSATTKLMIGSGQPVPVRDGVNLPVALELSNSTKESTITDYPVLRRAAELAVGKEKFESQAFSNLEGDVQASQQKIAARYGVDENAVDRVVRNLEKYTEVARERDGQIVEIEVVAEDPDEAKLFSWAVAEGAHQFHKEKARESFQSFLDDLNRRIAEAENNLQSAQESLTAAQRELKVNSVSDKERMILENIYRLEDEEAKLVALSRKNDRLIQSRLQEQSFGSRADVAREAETASSRELADVRDRLFKAKLDLDARISTYSAKHPEVLRIRREIAGLEKMMAREQEQVLNRRYQQFSQETNKLIRENALFALEREVMLERKARLNEELFQLTEVRQEFEPKRAAFEQAQERLNYLLGMHKNFAWYSDANLGSVVVYDPAIEARPGIVPGRGIGPLTLTLLMAFIFAIGVVYIVEYVDTRVKTEHDIRRHLNLPLLGVIPKEFESSRLLTDAPPQSEISEKFNTAATLIQSTARELNLRSLMVCSAIAREGKTTVSVNMAVALARKGARVVLIDGDLRISQVHNVLRVPNHVGLSTALDSRVTQSQVIDGIMSEQQMQPGHVNVSSVVQKTPVENLFVITSGPPTQDPVHLLESGRLARLVSELKQEFDFVIFDTPPINKVGDALTISSVVDGAIFVVGAGQAEQHDVMWAKHLLQNVQSNVLGVFLNKFTKQRGGEYSYYYYYNDAKRKRVKTRA